MADILRTLQLRYGEIDTGTPLARLLMKQHRNRARREVIEAQLRELGESAVAWEGTTPGGSCRR
ncbi:MAG: hypothetical protein ACLFWM_12010 [Actinomycetota bacterium]